MVAIFEYFGPPPSPYFDADSAPVLKCKGVYGCKKKQAFVSQQHHERHDMSLLLQMV